jgi:hypothetical protein
VDFGVNDGKILWDQGLPPARDLPVSAAPYWTTMVLSAWQADEDEDKDPDSESATGGISAHKTNPFTQSTESVSSLGFGYTGLCAVFKAVKQDQAESDIPEKFTVAHEIGHTFGLEHDPGMMCEIGSCQAEPFGEISLDKLRDYVQP